MQRITHKPGPNRPEDFDDEFDLISEDTQPPSREAEIECEFLTGAAGTGKTFEIRRRMQEDKNYGVLAATTGIAAVNLGEGVTTINSLLGFYDEASLAENVMSGKLRRRLIYLAEEGVKRIVIDEVSMMGAGQLEIITQALDELRWNGRGNIGLVLTGDFCQLPPVKAKWAFEASCWSRFAANTTRLTKVWRQSNTVFLDALNRFRSGDGYQGFEFLKQTPFQLENSIDENFDGSTIVATNDLVDWFNHKRLGQLEGKEFSLKSIRWAAPEKNNVLKQWSGIPAEATFKEGALVMILANEPEFEYANGDLAHIIGFDHQSKTISLQLIRNDEVIQLGMVVRQSTQKECPDRWKAEEKKGSGFPISRKQAKEMHSGIGPMDLSYYDVDRAKWVVGEVIYYPMRLGWATTIHKSQGLSLNRVQVSVRERFVSAPAMEYVAFSRCREPEGLRIIGSPGEVINKCKTDPKVKEWL